jgi:hypothetical protein
MTPKMSYRTPPGQPPDDVALRSGGAIGWPPVDHRKVSIGSERQAICSIYVWKIFGVYVAAGSLNDKNLRAEHCD